MTVDAISPGDQRVVSKAELFLGFFKVGVLGFGGVAPIARHVIVEERRWLSDAEYAEILGVGQMLPGPNTMNAAVFIGDRFQGVPGVLLCIAGQMAAPLVLVTTLGVVYERFADVVEVRAALLGAAAGAAGLVAGTALKTARRINPAPAAIITAAAAFAAVGLMGWPLLPVVGVLAPLAILFAGRTR